MVLLTPDPDGVPFLENHRWVRERAREERLVLLHLSPVRSPYVSAEQRVKIEHFTPRLVRVKATFGYMEPPRIDPVLRSCDSQGLHIDNSDTSFFYADPKIEAAPHPTFPPLLRSLYAILQRNSRPLPDDLHIVAERRVELGVTVAL
jgi:KUP system potassium uptake protein